MPEQVPRPGRPHRPTRHRALLSTSLAALAAVIPASAAPPPTDGCMPADYFIFFDARSTAISGPAVDPHLADRAARLLDRVASGWTEAHGRITIEGHEDGAEATQGRHYGAARTETLQAALITRGVDPAAIDRHDLAADAPLVPTSGDGEEQQNRFAKIRLLAATTRCLRGIR